MRPNGRRTANVEQVEESLDPIVMVPVIDQTVRARSGVLLKQMKQLGFYLVERPNTAANPDSPGEVATSRVLPRWTGSRHRVMVALRERFARLARDNVLCQRRAK